MNWAAFEVGAPEIAAAGSERLRRAGLALLGTVRDDGFPRISPVEPHLVAGELVFGAMTWSGKARDLVRDGRCVLHSPVSDPNGSEGEFKLYARAREVDDPAVRDGAPEAWWTGRPAEDARVFSLAIEHAVLVTWETERGVVTIRRWSPDRGVSTVERSYP